MCKFNIGQKVVCIKTHHQGAIKKGQIFVVRGIKQKTCCGMYVVDIGVSSIYEYSECYCGTLSRVDGIWWLDENRFAPIQEDSQEATQAVESLIEELNEKIVVKIL